MEVIDEYFKDSRSANPDSFSLTDHIAVRTYPFTNGLASVAELVFGVVGGNIAVAVDGMHGSAEIVVANAQIKAAHETDHIEDHRRRRIYSLLSGLALAGGGLAGVEMTGSIDLGTTQPVLDYLGMGAASLSAASAIMAAGCLVHRTRRKYGEFWHAPMTETELDVTRHVVKLDAPSASLAAVSSLARVASLFTHSKGFPIDPETLEHGVGVASGLWGAYLFRPTRSNLEHHHAANTETMPPIIEELETMPRWKRFMQRCRNLTKTTD